MTSTPSAAVAIIRTHEPMDSFLLLRRNQNPNDPWSGHFSFPGGRKDETDKDLFETCLRETYEETGIALQAESLQADMPSSIAGSRFNSPILVKPYLFQLETQPPLKLDHGEIQSSCWLKTNHFLNTALHVEAEVLPNMHFPAFPLSDYYLWGFTYKLLINLLELQIAWKN